MRHSFWKIEHQHYPIPGDLIRSEDTMNFINIVLSVSEETVDDIGTFVYVRSVRYGATNRGKFRLLNGKRSRSFKWYNPLIADKWQIVEEFVPYHNIVLRANILAALKDVDTSYKG